MIDTKALDFADGKGAGMETEMGTGVRCRWTQTETPGGGRQRDTFWWNGEKHPVEGDRETHPVDGDCGDGEETELRCTWKQRETPGERQTDTPGGV